MIETYQAAAAPAASLSEICDALIWERYATVEGFVEGPNFDKDGNLWVVGIASGGVMRVHEGGYEVVGEQSGLPNGARIAPDG